MTRADELALVIELACLTGDRSNQEQRALLGIARQCDDERNRHKRRAYEHECGMDSMHYDLLDPSDLESLVDRSRVLEDGQKRVTLKSRNRRPWADAGCDCKASHNAPADPQGAFL